jgi:DNA-binding transcriptional MocR family regulator
MATSMKAAATISLARGAPSLDIIDIEGLREAAARAFANDPGGATAYGTSVGYLPLRRLIAEWHGVDEAQVLVTNGSLQGDAFLFDELVSDGSDVVVERPTYDRTLLGLRERGARLHGVPLASDGIDVDALAALITAGVTPTLAHIIPNFQNPAGYTLSAGKRERLLELAREHSFTIFEDDPYISLRFRGETLPTMLALDSAGESVVYASSFSKTVCPGIRIGYLVGPPALIARIARRATNTYISPSMVGAAIVYEFCASGALDRSIATVRSALAERSGALARALARELPEVRIIEPDGGYFLWVELPDGIDSTQLTAAAADHGVAVVDGDDFVADGRASALRLSFAPVTVAEIDEAISRLAAAYATLA